MGKLMVLTITENEEHILSDIQRYLQSETDYTDIGAKQEMILPFPDLEIDLYRREVRRKQKSIKLTDLEFRILYYLASEPGRVFTYQQIYEGVHKSCRSLFCPAKKVVHTDIKIICNYCNLIIRNEALPSFNS